MKSQYLIFPEFELIVESFVGEMEIDEFINFKRDEMNDPDFSPNYRVITDLRWVTFLFNTSEVSRVSEFLKDEVWNGFQRKSSILTTDPLQTAYSLVFKKYTLGSGVIFNVCTTVDEALRWVDYPMDEKQMIQVLDTLKRNLQAVS